MVWGFESPSRHQHLAARGHVHALAKSWDNGAMKPSMAFARHRDEIRRIVEQHRARNPRVFGSVLRGEDGESSDLDLLVEPTADTTLLDVACIEVELRCLLGVPVDVLTPGALPDKFRANVLAEAIAV